MRYCVIFPYPSSLMFVWLPISYCVAFIGYTISWARDLHLWPFDFLTASPQYVGLIAVGRTCCENLYLPIMVDNNVNYIYSETTILTKVTQNNFLIPPPTKVVEMRWHPASVCLLVCQEHISKSYWRIWTKFYGMTGSRPEYRIIVFPFLQCKELGRF